MGSWDVFLRGVTFAWEGVGVVRVSSDAFSFDIVSCGVGFIQ
jgi:hypothetical protein